MERIKEIGAPSSEDPRQNLRSPKKAGPDTSGRPHVQPAVRVGLILGLVSASLFAARAMLRLIHFSDLTLNYQAYNYMLAVVVEKIALYAGILGLAGNVTAGRTLPRRAAVAVTLVLILAFSFYIVHFIILDRSLELNLTYFIGTAIVWTFPQACVSFVLWRKDGLPKVMAVVACAYSACLIILTFTNNIQYFAYFDYYNYGRELDYGAFAQGWMVGMGVMYAFYFLWCILWVDLNARPARYLAMHMIAAQPSTTRSLRRRGYVLIGVTALWALGWWLISLAPEMNWVSIHIQYRGWSYQDAWVDILFFTELWWNVPVIVILSILAAYLLVRARRLDKAVRKIGYRKDFIPQVH